MKRMLFTGLILLVSGCTTYSSQGRYYPAYPDYYYWYGYGDDIYYYDRRYHRHRKDHRDDRKDRDEKRDRDNRWSKEWWEERYGDRDGRSRRDRWQNRDDRNDRDTWRDRNDRRDGDGRGNDGPAFDNPFRR